MKRQTGFVIFLVVIALLLMVLPDLSIPSAAAGGTSGPQVTISGTLRQITTNPAPQLEPSISGNIVVYVDQRNGNDDVYFTDLSTGAETQITTNTAPQRLHDVSGTRIVYTDLTPPVARIMLYDTATGMTRAISSGSDQNARIDGDIVVFQRGPTSNPDIVAVNLATGAETIVAGTAALEVAPSVSGTRVVYERHMILGDEGDILMFDLSTGVETVLAATVADERRPDINGDIVVWDVVGPAGDIDIAIHNLTTDQTRVPAMPGNQLRSHISGQVVSFDDDSAGNFDVALYHIPSGAMLRIGGSNADLLTDIDGNRLLFSSNEAGNLDIWEFEFAIQPPLGVAPASVQFGPVNVGSSQTQVVTITNLENHAASVQNVALDLSGGGFSFGPLTLPQTLVPGASLDISVTFAPTAAATSSNTLRITTTLSEVLVPLSGQGVSATGPPQQQIADILAFFDSSVQTGTLNGNGLGNSGAGRRNALRNRLTAAGNLIQQGRTADACQQLLDALNRTDGNSLPPDFVTGPAAADLAQRIRTLRATLGCG
jgi:beta propeller repeat protein